MGGYNRMSFSTEWEDVYRSGAHESIWPWSDVVSLNHRYLKEKEKRCWNWAVGLAQIFLFFSRSVFSIMESKEVFIRQICLRKDFRMKM